MMAKIAMRRTASRKSPKSFWPARAAAPRCKTSGTTMSLEIITDNATHSTITIAVAADRPPMKTPRLSSGGVSLDRQRQHIHVAVDGAERKADQAGERDRDHEQVDGDQVERKQPARPADLGIAGILDHADVKLAGQQHDRAER